MISYDDILSSIKSSDISLIGYTFNNERIKDELISNFNYVEISEIDSSFCFKSFLRDLKLDSVLRNSVKKPDCILIDLNNIKSINSDLGSKHRQIKKILTNLHQSIYSEQKSSFPSNPKFKVILTCSLYKSSPDNNHVNFSGGSSPIYISDFSITIQDDKITIIKERIHDNCGEILYKSKEELITFVK